jgi:DNA polymerase-3 subunit epsilon
VGFVALDVETANSDFSSICQIGIARFDGDRLTEEWSTLVNPEDYFDPFNVSIHGITEDMVGEAHSLQT